MCFPSAAVAAVSGFSVGRTVSRRGVRFSRDLEEDGSVAVDHAREGNVEDDDADVGEVQLASEARTGAKNRLAHHHALELTFCRHVVLMEDVELRQGTHQSGDPASTCHERDLKNRENF